MEIKNKEIFKLDHYGRGITYVNDKVTFVEKALKDEIVNIEITNETKKYNEAKITKIIKENPERREAPCKYYNVCGGCDLMHMNYKEQLNFKKEKVSNIIKRYAGIDVKPRIIKSESELGYRNKITLHKKNNKQGFYKENTNDIIEIDKCLIAKDKINEKIKEINSSLKNIIMRTNDKEVIYNKDEVITKKINKYKFKVNINSFFQVNDYICKKLFKLVEENIEKNEKVLDLYSGVSTLSIVASKNAKIVYSIEENEYAHNNALENIKLNKISNVYAIHGKVEDILKTMKRRVDTIIIDPPRKGLDKITMNYLLTSNTNKIIYISCDPMTYARDLNLLKQKYKLETIKLLDMFPNTHHVEIFSVLTLK